MPSRFVSITRRLALPAVVASVLAAPGVAYPVTADPGPAPAVMTALGDSITRGFNTCGWYRDCPTSSWSTGEDALVNSHYVRIKARNGAITGRNSNVAASGARASALSGQVQTAVHQKAQYVTVLIGANDACAASESTMTSVATFRTQINNAFAALKQGLPNARVLVLSIPDLKRLWAIGSTSIPARSAWRLLNVCQSMLVNPASTAQADRARRDRVRQRVIDYNTQLAAACTAFGPNCRSDQNAVFAHPFVLHQVSRWDYFHPSGEGQRALARISYAAGFGW